MYRFSFDNFHTFLTVIDICNNLANFNFSMTTKYPIIFYGNVLFVEKERITASFFSMNSSPFPKLESLGTPLVIDQV